MSFRDKILEFVGGVLSLYERCAIERFLTVPLTFFFSSTKENLFLDNCTSDSENKASAASNWYLPRDRANTHRTYLHGESPTTSN